MLEYFGTMVSTSGWTMGSKAGKGSDCGLSFNLNQLLMVIGSIVILVLLFLVVCHITSGRWRYGEKSRCMLQCWFATSATHSVRFRHSTDCNELDVQILPRHLEEYSSRRELVMSMECGLTFSLNQFLTVVGSLVVLILLFFFVCNVIANKCGC